MAAEETATSSRAMRMKTPFCSGYAPSTSSEHRTVTGRTSPASRVTVTLLTVSDQRPPEQQRPDRAPGQQPGRLAAYLGQRREVVDDRGLRARLGAAVQPFAGV